MTFPHGKLNIMNFYKVDDVRDGVVVAPPDWVAHNIITVKLPGPMAIAGHPGALLSHVAFHKLCASSFLTVMQDLWDNQQGIWKKIEWDGSFVQRLKRGSDEFSLHAIGAAFDINGDAFPMDRSKVFQVWDMPEWMQAVVIRFREAGWKWGGDFGDPMHIQAASGF